MPQPRNNLPLDSERGFLDFCGAGDAAVRWAEPSDGLRLGRIAGVGPRHGAGHRRVEVGHETPQLLFQICHRLEIATAHHLAIEDPEHRLDLNQLRAVLGHEEKVHAMRRIGTGTAITWARLRK